MKITRLFTTTLLILAPTFAYSDETPKEKTKSIAYVRILHAIAGAPSADFYFDDQKVSEKISFKTVTDYFQVPSGKTIIRMAAAGNEATLLDGSATFSRDGYYTIAPYGTMDKARLTVQNDLTSKSDEKQARIRVFHLAPGAPKLSFAFTSRQKPNIIKDLEYGEDTTKLIEPGTLIVQVGINNKVVYALPKVSLEAGKRYAVFAVGKLNLPGPQAFELIIQTMGSDEKM
ncbi:MAG TPA: DUF4397 domain-containing protein [Abditibacteriaceae bacterium]|jgi:hypothetical protein